MNRKSLPLALLYAEESTAVEGRTRLQKLVFLLEQALKDKDQSAITDDDYGFIAYDYGPFSKSLYDDLDELHAKGLVAESTEEISNGQVKYEYRLTKEGEAFVREQLSSDEFQKIRSLASDLKSEYNDVLLSDLIEYVYSEYPEYAENSVW